MIFKEWSDNQRRIFIDTTQLYEAFSDIFHKNRAYRGGMHWKKAKGREYLFRSLDRFGNGKSLGPRSEQTEQMLENFRRNKQEIKQRIAIMKKRIAEQSRFCKAAAIQRVPRIVTAILRVLEQQNILGKNVMVVGTHAMAAYEASAGIFIDSPLVATRDMDILWDTRTGLKLFGDEGVRKKGLIGILQKADRSFEAMDKRGFTAVNQKGFMVDLIKPEPRSLFDSERRRMGMEGDLMAAEIRNLQWLVSAPKFVHVVIGDDGYPASMVAPDPRAFALHKLWLAEQVDREKIKKQRDRRQGATIAAAVVQYMPEYPFAASELRMFPKAVVERAKDQIRIFESDMPVGFDTNDEIW